MTRTQDAGTKETEPLNAGRVVILSLGMGRDSVTMLCLLKEHKLTVEVDGERREIGPRDVDAVVFSDTGCEWQHTYDAVSRIRGLCESMNVRMVVLEKPAKADWMAWLTKKAAGMVRRSDRPDWIDNCTPCDGFSMECITGKASNGSYHNRAPVLEDYKVNRTVVLIQSGSCTCSQKIDPIRRLIADLAAHRFGVSNNAAWGRLVRKGERKKHISLVGFAADERTRVAHATSESYHEPIFPLMTMNITKAGEAPILERHGLNDIRKSGCYVCPFQPMGWYWALRETDPETFARVVEYERVSLERNAKVNITGAKAGGRSLTIDELVNRWREKNPDATVQGVLDKSYDTGRRPASDT